MSRPAARVAVLLTAALAATGLALPAAAAPDDVVDAPDIRAWAEAVVPEWTDGRAPWITGPVREDATVRPQMTQGSRFIPVDPMRLVDTREDVGPLGPRMMGRADFSEMPEEVVALVFNVTATKGTAATSFISVLDGNAPLGLTPSTSSVNSIRGRDIANQVTVPLTANGEVRFYNHAGYTHVVADLVGVYVTDVGLGYVPVAPQRVFDGRKDGAHISGEEKYIPMPTAPADAYAVAFTLTSTRTQAKTTFVSIGGEGSVLNSYSGSDVANLVVSELYGDEQEAGIFLYNNKGVNHLIVDVVGWYVLDRGADFFPMSAVRATGSGRMGEAEIRSFPRTATRIPADATAVALNLTTAGATRSTYLTAYPTGATRPNASSTNARVGADVATAVVTEARPGFNLYNNRGSVRALVDVSGYFGPSK